MNNQITNKERKALYEKSLIYDATLDGSGLGSLWHPKGKFQIASFPQVEGNQNIAGFFNQFFSYGMFTKLEHEMLEVWDLDDVLIYSALAVYTRPDGSILKTPYTNIVKYKDGLFWDYKVFIDTAPLKGA
jgi:hypothetical protein